MTSGVDRSGAERGGEGEGGRGRGEGGGEGKGIRMFPTSRMQRWTSLGDKTTVRYNCRSPRRRYARYTLYIRPMTYGEIRARVSRVPPVILI